MVRAIDEKYSHLKYLVEMLIEIYHIDLLLMNKSIRTEIVLSLNRSEIIELASQLKCPLDNDPYEHIGNLPFVKKNTQMGVLYDFFEVDLPLDENNVVNENVLTVSTITPNYPLYVYQRKAASKALSIISLNNDGKVLMHMPTGSGKTRSAMYLICKTLSKIEKGLVIWLAHSEELCNQSAEEFEKAWASHGNREMHITRYYGEYDCDISTVDNGVLVSSLSKLYKRSFSEQSSFLKMQKNAVLVVIDEAHQAIAETYKHLLELLLIGGKVKLLGLSATPGRSLKDIGKDQELANFFNRNKVTLTVDNYDNPINFLQDNGYLATPSYNYYNYVSDVVLSEKQIIKMKDGLDIDKKTLVKIGKDLNRNLLVMEMIETLARKHKKIIVFSASVEQSDLIASILTIMNYSAKSLTSNHSLIYRRNIISSFKSNDENSLSILVNFGILTTGFDAPNASAAVIARPTQSVVLYSQMVGRVLRGIKSGGNKNCEISTVVDNIQGFRSIYEGFSHWDDVWV
jgi:superfamily II DNA or RNA helicase